MPKFSDTRRNETFPEKSRVLFTLSPPHSALTNTGRCQLTVLFHTSCGRVLAVTRSPRTALAASPPEGAVVVDSSRPFTRHPAKETVSSKRATFPTVSLPRLHV